MSRAFRYLLIGSGVLRIVLAFVVADIEPRYDETEFLAFGRAIVEDGEAPRLWRAPGYQWFVAAGLAASGGHPLGVRLLQALLSIATCWLTYRLGRRIRGERTGLVAGSLLAFYPSHIAFSHLFWSETLFGFLVLAAFDRSLAADTDRSWRTALVAGLLFGAAALTRSLGLALLGASAAWMLVSFSGRRFSFRQGSPLLVAALLSGGIVAVAPWAIHASGRAGRLVITDTNSGFNLWSGNNEYIPPDVQGLWAVGLPPANGADERFTFYHPDDTWRRQVRGRMAADGVREPEGPDGDDWYRGEAVRMMLTDPLGVLARAPKKIAAFWAPDFFLARHLVRDWYGPLPPLLVLVLVFGAWASSSVPLIGGLASLASTRPDRFRGLVVLWVATYVLLHALAYGHTRMHQPLVPLLLLAVGAAVSDGVSRKSLLRHGFPWLGVVLGLWTYGLPVWGGLYLAPGPRHLGLARAMGVASALPLPGAARLAWTAAIAEASSGRNAEASKQLEQGRHADLPWTLYLRALMSSNMNEQRDLLDRALGKNPELEAALHMRRILEERTSVRVRGQDSLE